jgi:acyl-coenzyme A thioesterase PaaI-like protein
MTGQMDAAARRETPTVPRGRPEHLFDVGPVLAESGQARASMPTGPWLRGPNGRPSPAGLGVLLDDVLGQAVLIQRSAGLWSVTTELNIDVVAPLPADGQVVDATASPVLIDDGGGLARGEVRDAAGRCLAVGTTWARFVPGVPDEIFDPPEHPDDTARGEGLNDLLQVCIPDTGLLDLPSRVDLANPRGVVHGGVLLCLAVMSADRALHDSQLEVASVRVVYPRPALGELTFEPVIVHRGRSLGVVRVDVKNVAGALCTSATVTARSAAGPRAGARTPDAGT